MCCRVMKEAKANELKLTPEFLELKFIEAVANNTKMFFGEKVRGHFPTSAKVIINALSTKSILTKRSC